MSAGVDAEAAEPEGELPAASFVLTPSARARPRAQPAAGPLGPLGPPQPHPHLPVAGAGDERDGFGGSLLGLSSSSSLAAAAVRSLPSSNGTHDDHAAGGPSPDPLRSWAPNSPFTSEPLSAGGSSEGAPPPAPLHAASGWFGSGGGGGASGGAALPETGPSRPAEAGSEGGGGVLVVTVSDPARQGEGVGAFVTYRVSTHSTLPGYRWEHCSVVRRYRDFEVSPHTMKLTA